MIQREEEKSFISLFILYVLTQFTELSSLLPFQNNPIFITLPFNDYITKLSKLHYDTYNPLKCFFCEFIN